MSDLLEVKLFAPPFREACTLPGVCTLNDLRNALDDVKVRGWLEVLDSEGRAGFYSVERVSAVLPVSRKEEG